MRSLYYTSFLFLALAFTSCSSQYEQVDVVDQTYVHKYGVAVPSDYWTKSGEDGAVITTMADGSVVSRNYVAGVLEGETTYTYPHSSQVNKKEIYKEGNIISETEFFFDGTPKKETAYNSPQQDDKTISLWYLSGTPKSVEQYNGELLVKGEYYSTTNQRDAVVEDSHGTRLIRDDYGQLLATETIQNGQLALSTTYHPNNSPKDMVPYVNGKIEGVKRTFYPAGEPNTVEEWVGGQQEGLTTIYQHGEKLAEVPHANGKPQGVEKRYRDGTQVVQEISWQNGQLHGPLTNHVGETTKTDWYYEGKQTTKTNYDFLTNKPVAR